MTRFAQPAPVIERDLERFVDRLLGLGLIEIADAV
jgi:hypothetical protein